MRNEVSGVRNSCATVATRLFFSSSKRSTRVTSWRMMVTPTSPPCSVVTREARGNRKRSFPSLLDTRDPHRLVEAGRRVAGFVGQGLAAAPARRRRSDLRLGAGQRLAGRLLDGDVQDALGGAVAAQEAPVEIEDQHRVGEAVDRRLGLLLRLQELARASCGGTGPGDRPSG